ncbi:MAG: putative manganese transporter [Clostridia bacterium]
MLPILLSEGANGLLILKILGIKILIGIIAGFLIDLILRKNYKNEKEEDIEDLCEHEHCHCEEGIWKSAIKHTVNVLVYILIISLIINIIIKMIGEETLGGLILNKPILGALIAGLIGLIPNCASSVILTQLYLSGVLKLSLMIGGLLVNAGVGLLVLFKVNHHPKQNIKIVLTLYAIGTISAIVLQFFEMKGLL